jgi:hypothetical protein
MACTTRTPDIYLMVDLGMTGVGTVLPKPVVPTNSNKS